MSKPYRVTVFCSANSNIDSFYFEAAAEFSRGLAKRGWDLVYGGSKVGLMGHLADTALKAGAKVRGAITEKLAKSDEAAHPDLTELVIVNDLYERKRWLIDSGDAFVIFPGGLGTLDESLEAITRKAMGDHSKPVIFFNLGGFWESQIQAFQMMAIHGMIRAEGGLGLYKVCDFIDDVWTELDGARKVGP